MSAKVFVDTNVLIYARDSTNPSKQKAAGNWLLVLAERNAAVVSRQSLREYYRGATRRGGDKLEARREVATLRPWVHLEGAGDPLADAWRIQDRYTLSFYDCLLLASARAAKCTHFLSEDMHAGLDVDGTRIVNFMATPPEAVFKD